MPYICTICNSTEVSTDVWQNLNDDTITNGAGEEYCHDCQSECNTEWIEEE